MYQPVDSDRGRHCSKDEEVTFTDITDAPSNECDSDLFFFFPNSSYYRCASNPGSNLWIHHFRYKLYIVSNFKYNSL